MDKWNEWQQCIKEREGGIGDNLLYGIFMYNYKAVYYYFKVELDYLKYILKTSGQLNLNTQ